MTRVYGSEAKRSATSRPAIQLHTVRAIDEPLFETVTRVAEAGYEGVEFASRFLDADPYAVRTALEETGTVPVAAHVELSRLEGNVESIVDRCRTVGCRHIVIPHIGAGHFRTVDRIDTIADRLESIRDRLEFDGIGLSCHSMRELFLPPLDQFGFHKLSSIPVPGGGWRWLAHGLGQLYRFDDTDILDRTAFGRLLERTSEGLTFEVDIGWVAAAGYDPTAVFDLLDDRLALIHVADVEMTHRFPPTFRSVMPGEGIVDVDRVVSAAHETDVEWLVFEDDDPVDPKEAIRQGIDVLNSRVKTAGQPTTIPDVSPQ